MRVLVADIEGNGLLDEVDTIWCIGIGDPRTGEVVMYADQPGYPSIAEALERLKEADRVVYHNGLGYDFPALNKLYPGTHRLEQIWDSLLVGQMLRPDIKDQRLASWGDYFKMPKGDHKEFSRFSEDMVTYCARDVQITLKLYRMLQKILKQWLDKGVDWRKAVEVEHRVGWVIRQQERHGFRLDVRSCSQLESELRQELADIERELQQTFRPRYVPDTGTWDYDNICWINVQTTTPKVNNRTTGVTKDVPYTKIVLQAFNPGSRKQCAERLSSTGRWVPSKFTDAGSPSVDEDVLSDLDFEEAKALSRYFRVSKQLGQIADGDNGWLRLEKDGRVHGRVNTCGARTFRMTHFKPNMAQVDKKDKRMRAVWTPDEGDKLVGCDAEGLELRMLAHRLHRWDNGEFAVAVISGKSSEGTDAHTRNQRLAGLYKRDSAKTLIYAFLYGAGNVKLGTIILDDALAAEQPRPKGAPAGIGKRVRGQLENGVTGLQQLVAACKHRTKERGYVMGLDGRPVRSNSEHSSLNTLLQSDGALVMKYALVIFHYELCLEKGYVDRTTYTPTTFDYCANVHDEVQLTVRPEYATELGQMFADAIRIAGERLGVKCPLAGAFAVGDNWAQTH